MCLTEKSHGLPFTHDGVALYRMSLPGGDNPQSLTLILCSLDRFRGMVDVYNYIIRVVNNLTFVYLFTTASQVACCYPSPLVHWVGVMPSLMVLFCHSRFQGFACLLLLRNFLYSHSNCFSKHLFVNLCCPGIEDDVRRDEIQSIFCLKVSSRRMRTFMLACLTMIFVPAAFAFAAHLTTSHWVLC